MTVISLKQSKGGQGTTTFAAALALEAAATGFDVLIVGHDADIPAVFGLASDEATQLTSSIRYHAADCAPEMAASVVILVGDAADNPPCAVDLALLVTRGCYLSLRRAVKSESPIVVDGVVFVAEDGRALKSDDVSNVLGLPIVATVHVTETVARVIDAGVLVQRRPGTLGRAARAVLTAAAGKVEEVSAA